MHKCTDQGVLFGALLTDLSKAFDSLPHDLLGVKLFACSTDFSSKRFFLNYLTNWKHRTKIAHAYTSGENIPSGYS